jgi:hypothetical protein
MKTLSELFKAQGELTEEQKAQFFTNLTEDTKQVILETTDNNFRKECLSAMLDYTYTLDKEFCNGPVIKATLKEMAKEIDKKMKDQAKTYSN